MSFKPHSVTERARMEKRIADMEEDIALRQSSLASLKQELERGRWCSDIDCSSLPELRPDCGICLFRVPILLKCSKGHPYGAAALTCPDYRHFTKGVGG